MDFGPLLAAGLSQTDIARVLGVSSVTINLWAKGKMKPHALHRERITEQLDTLLKAAQTGRIPKRRGNLKTRQQIIEDAIKSISTAS